MNYRRLTKQLGILALAALPSFIFASEDERIKASTWSKPLVIDKIIQSMDGPQDSQRLSIAKSPGEKLLWLTGMQTQAFDEQRANQRSLKHLCHSSVAHYPRPFSKGQRLSKVLNQREMFGAMFPGVSRIEFPAGFGIPFFASDRINTGAMAFNQEAIDKPTTMTVKNTIEYVADENLKEPYRALFLRKINQYLPNSKTAHGDDCSMDHDVKAVKPAKDIKFTEVDHWQVPPGRHVFTRKLRANGLELPFDTKVHYIYIHLHPYGKSIELRDLTANKVVFKSHAHTEPNSSVIERSDVYSSTSGIQLYVNHEYQLTSVYNNTTKQNVDAMAIMYLYLAERDFSRDLLARDF